MSISGHQALTKVKRENSSGCPMVNPSHTRTGTPANPTTLSKKTKILKLCPKIFCFLENLMMDFVTFTALNIMIYEYCRQIFE